MKFYQMDAEKVLEELRTSERGLSSEEAEERLQQEGENVLKQKHKNSPIKIFLSQFTGMMTLLLILAGIVSLVFAIVNHESIAEALVIFGCILINAIMGFVQELKSENAIESLKTMSNSVTQVKRDGKWIEIDSAKLVSGGYKNYQGSKLKG